MSVELKLIEITRADYKRRYSPAEKYAIYSKGQQVGRIDFRIGQNKQLCHYAGQIGYGVEEEFRGHGYAAKALKLLLPHCFRYFPEVYITCSVDNAASIKTIEKAGGEYLGDFVIPKNNEMRSKGYDTVRRYRMVAPSASSSAAS